MTPLEILKLYKTGVVLTTLACLPSVMAAKERANYALTGIVTLLDTTEALLTILVENKICGLPIVKRNWK